MADNAGSNTDSSSNSFNIFSDPVRNISAVLSDLSPKGLAERGIPFAHVLKMPRSALLGSVIINLCGLALPLVILQVYDRIIPNFAIETFHLLLLGLTGVVILEAFLRIARSYVISWSATRFTKAITQDLIGRYLYAPNGAFAGTLPSQTIERLGRISRVADFYGGQSRLMFIDLPFAFLFLAVMGLVGGWLVIVPFAILCFFGLATIAASRSYRTLILKKEEHEARIYDFVAETLNGILTMKSNAAEPLLMRRFERLQSTNAQLHYGIITTAMHSQMIAGLLGNGTMIAMVSTGAVLAVYGQMSIGVLACCSLLSGRAVQPILRVASTWNEFQSARLAVEELSKLFAIEDTPDQQIAEKISRPPRLVARNLTIRAPSTGALLENVNLVVEPGEVLAIVGKDGSGKSTFLRTLSGFLQADAGEIYLDDVPAYQFRKSQNTAVGYVDASTEVFVGSIFDNLSLFGQGALPENVRWAANLLGISREIDRLPEGYDTQLGRGITETLPAGLINRLLQARILAQKPVLWALDEPQGDLDTLGLEAFMNAMDSLRGEISIIYSTHSKRLLQKADQIIYLANGEYTIFRSYEEYEANKNSLANGSHNNERSAGDTVVAPASLEELVGSAL